MQRVRAPFAALAGALSGALLLVVLAAPAVAQKSSREAERKLDTVKRELQAVAAERRKLEGKRGAATRELRRADEQVNRSSRRLRDTEQQLARSQASLDELQQQRDRLQAKLGDQRAELAGLLRAAYAHGGATPLKVLLAQDRVADANRLLTYHRYLQRDRARRIAALSAELGQVDALERDIAARRDELGAVRAQQREQLAQLQRDRKARATLVARLERSYQDKRSREQTLGRNAQGLEQLLKKLRAAAAREAARKADAARKARDAAKANGKPGTAPPPVRTAGQPAPQVGGLGWPLAGSLLAGYGGKMPDGRNSDGLLIGADAGTPVKAVANGSVVYAEWMTGYGLLLIIDHGNDYMSLYAHNDALLREAGDVVQRGDAVSTVGSSGGHGRPALYFELRRGGQTVNPNTWLKR